MFKTDWIIVMDLEATCWGNDAIPKGSHIDIIEIGICGLMLNTGKIWNKQSIYVIPKRSEITPFCTELTGITKELIAEKGISFREACRKITEEYMPEDRIWGSWGDFDRLQILAQCSEQGIKIPFSSKHLEIKTEFAHKMKLKRSIGLKKALALIKDPLEGQHHCGADDAYNTAKILRHILHC